MDRAFWERRWRENRIGFHSDEVNRGLMRYLPDLGLAPGARILVPLSGKTLDIGWLADRQLRPVGVEFSRLAVEALFREQGLEPRSESRGTLQRWAAGGIMLYCGDFFDLSVAELGTVQAAWDRAALIALPADVRPAYAAHCARLLPAGASVLLVTLAYDHGSMEGPPFAVEPREVESLYAPWFHVRPLIDDRAMEPPPHLAAQGMRNARESVWRLMRRVDHTGSIP